MAHHILRIDGSARKSGSITRDLTDQVIAKLGAETVTTRDLSDGVPLLTEDWVAANFTPAAERSEAQRAILATSDTLVAELTAADTIVIGAPIYNFGAPAAVKAWIDQVARAGVTFAYTPEGPKGLLTGKRAIIVTASGGTKVGSEIEFAVNHLRHVLGFIGITDVELVAADQMMITPDQSLAEAGAAITGLAA
ncbi:MAG: NAD(P)H-dependent oxidoreductase [Pseudomonadota bacterium]